jgi:hypothetical protein
MKLLESKQLTRVVEYFGYAVTIPAHHRWLATEYDGKVYSYASKPVKASAWGFCGNGDLTHVADMSMEDTPWQETRVEYPL